jgi:hypothetical protein
LLVKRAFGNSKKAKETILAGNTAVRGSGSFNITKADGSIVQGISYRYCRLDYRSDGYSYSQKGGGASPTC